MGSYLRLPRAAPLRTNKHAHHLFLIDSPYVYQESQRSQNNTYDVLVSGEILFSTAAMVFAYVCLVGNYDFDFLLLYEGGFSK